MWYVMEKNSNSNSNVALYTISIKTDRVKLTGWLWGCTVVGILSY